MPELTRDGVRLYWSERGAGPTVLWHTGGGGDGSMWERAGYLDRLPDRRHLLFDHRGHGRSDKPAALDAHGIDQYIADVLATLDAIEVQQATLVGYSDGSRVLYQLAARHPDRVAAVIGIGGVSHPRDTNAGRRAEASDVRERGFRAWLQEASDTESAPAPGWLIENLAGTPTEMFALELEAWADEPVECVYFPQISAPVLIICGERENTDGSVELAIESLPNGTAKVLSNSGHLQAFWRTDLTAPVIADFLAGHVPV